MTSVKTLRAVLLVALVALVASPIAAQESRDRRGGQDREQLMERIRARMAAMTQERLGLTDAESERLSEVVRRFEQQRRELARSDMALRRQVDALAENDVSDEEATALLTEMVELRRQEGQLFEAELVALGEVLTPSQIIEFQALREEMGRRIRSLRGGDRRNGREPQDDRRRRRRGGGGSGGSAGLGPALDTVPAFGVGFVPGAYPG